MPICIECCYPVQQLYTAYSKADDRSLGNGVRLTQCPRCNQFADKYVEHDFVVIFVDLVLIKPQVYRHLLFNRLGDNFPGPSSSTNADAEGKTGEGRDGRARSAPTTGPIIFRLGMLLLLFDVYLTWARIERSMVGGSGAGCVEALVRLLATEPSLDRSMVVVSPFAALPKLPLIGQYMFFLVLCAISMVSFHLPIRLLCMYPPRVLVKMGLLPAPAPLMPPSGLDGEGDTAEATDGGDDRARKEEGTEEDRGEKRRARDERQFLSFFETSPISTALFVSSGTKLFPLLLLIWNYDLPSAATALNCAVTVNNIAAVRVVLADGNGFVPAGPDGLDGEGPSPPAATLPNPATPTPTAGTHGRAGRARKALRYRVRESRPRAPLRAAIFLVAVGAFVRVAVVAVVLTGLGLYLGRAGCGPATGSGSGPDPGPDQQCGECVAGSGRERVDPFRLLDPWVLWQLSWRCGLGFVLA